jgi:hypothetical protein
MNKHLLSQILHQGGSGTTTTEIKVANFAPEETGNHPVACLLVLYQDKVLVSDGILLSELNDNIMAFTSRTPENRAGIGMSIFRIEKVR